MTEQAPKHMRRLSTQDGTFLGYTFWCPGCFQQVGLGHHAVYLTPHQGQPDAWEFDGNMDAPTFNPSLLTEYPYTKDGVTTQVRCHLFIRRGMIVYCGDCTHPLAGKTVEMSEGAY